jgi:hypothetical protein
MHFCFRLYSNFKREKAKKLKSDNDSMNSIDVIGRNMQLNWDNVNEFVSTKCEMFRIDHFYASL